MGKLWEPGERYYPPRYPNRRRPFYDRGKRKWPWKKFLWQSAASLLIFLMIWGIFQFNSPVVQPVQAKIKGWFTEDYDITPVLKFFNEVGLWGDTFDRAAFEASQLPENPGPLTVPVSGQIIKPFGWVISENQGQSFHDGIVIAAPEGAPIKAALGGVVTRLANEAGVGRTVEITGNGFVFTYGHCGEVLVNLNDEIHTGQVIAKIGKTGNAVSPQLFFRVTKDGEPLDPAVFFIPEASKI